MEMNRDLQISLANLFKARFPYVYISTWEEKRAIAFIEHIASDETLIKHKRKVFSWSQTKGFVNHEQGKCVLGTADPLKAFDFVEKTSEDAIFIFKDLHVYFGVQGKSISYDLIRRMRDIITVLQESAARKNVVLISPELIIPADMQKEITVFDFPLPNVKEMNDLLADIIEKNELDDSRLSTEERERLAKSALGLTMQEAENAFARSIVQNQGIDKNAMDIIFEEKNQIIKKTGILEFVKSDFSLEDVGGLENLKNWLMKRNNSWLEQAKAYNIPAPKGVLITGVPGCGKSLTAKAISRIWKLPLLKLDMGKIFSGIVGSSEENMRRAIATAEAVAPSILWVDEIEKGFTPSSHMRDGGTGSRVFGSFLTWMQEKTAPVFVIATANDIHGLPPELLRKGRFDEIFFVDLPTASEREKIFDVHLRRRVKGDAVGSKVSVDDALLRRLSAMTEGFVGAEIEQVVIAALYEAFFHQRELVTEDLETAIRNMVPLSVTQKEQIRSLREWADARAVSAALRKDVDLPAEAFCEENTSPEHHGGRLLDF